MGLEVLVATAVLSTVASTVEARKSSKRQQRANKISQNQQQGNERISRNQQIRERRIRRARILSSAQNTGGEGSSAESGSLSSLETLVGFNLGVQRGNTLNNIAIGNMQQKAADSASRANTYQALGNLASQGAMIKGS